MSTLSRRIQRGNAAEVKVASRSITIIPEEQSRTSSREEFRDIRYYALDIVNGFRSGWMIRSLVCSGTCSVDTTVAPNITYLPILNYLGSSWDEAWLVVNVEHVGADGNDWLFEVSNPRLVPVQPPEVANIVYKNTTDGFGAFSADTVFTVTEGTYAVRIATRTNGVITMTTQYQQPSVLNTYRNTDLAEAASYVDPGLYYLDVAVRAGSDATADHWLQADSPGEFVIRVEYGGVE